MISRIILKSFHLFKKNSNFDEVLTIWLSYIMIDSILKHWLILTNSEWPK